MSDMNNFEREMEHELHRILDPITAGPIPFRRSMQPGGSMKRLLGGAGVAIGVKILTGIAVAAAATTFAVAATEVAITGSANPTNWGHQVVTQVNACKASAARLGVHGIGQCVASFARTHGDTVSDGHAKNDKTKTGKEGNGHANPNANAPGNGGGNGKNTTHGNSSNHPTPPVETSSLIQFVF
jgi:hypothetical protein